MKNHKNYFVLILFLSLGLHSFAAAEVGFSGELAAAFAYKQLPTRDQGLSAFSLPRLNLNIEAPLRDNNEVYLQLESSEYRDGTSRRFDTQLKEAYLSLTSVLPARSELRYGLIPDYYIELQKEQWDYDFWGNSSLVPMIKYKYASWSDLGAMYQGQLPEDWGQWAVSATNGEGYQSDETGQRKQAQLVLGLTKAAPFFAMLAYSYGNYDDYDSTFNTKSRLVANLSYEFSRGLLVLEYYSTQDPADAISTGRMAAGVDVTSLHATVVNGEGANLFGRWDLNEKTDLFVRLDYLTPVKSEKNKNLKAISTGASYDLSDDIRGVFAFDYTDYSEDFSAAIRDESQFVLATRVSF